MGWEKTYIEKEKMENQKRWNIMGEMKEKEVADKSR